MLRLSTMLPVLFSIGPLSISSFGLFLALAFLYGTYLVWRLARAWDLPEEKILDLVILSFFGGLIGARLFFVALNFDYFLPVLYKTLLITKYPGLSFWGGFLGGWLTLFYFCRRFKLNFWQIADLASIGFLAGLILGDIGCFLGGCSVGKMSNLFLATGVVGQIGNRLPISLIEAIIFAFILFSLWPKAIRFHFNGKILSLSLILIGLVKLSTEFFRAPVSGIGSFGGFILSAVTLILGIYIFYNLSKRSFVSDLTSLKSSSRRKALLDGLSKQWYNQKIIWSLRIKKINFTKILRRARVKLTPRDIQ